MKKTNQTTFLWRPAQPAFWPQPVFHETLECSVFHSSVQCFTRVFSVSLECFGVSQQHQHFGSSVLVPESVFHIHSSVFHFHSSVLSQNVSKTFSNNFHMIFTCLNIIFCENQIINAIKLLQLIRSLCLHEELTVCSSVSGITRALIDSLKQLSRTLKQIGKQKG